MLSIIYFKLNISKRVRGFALEFNTLYDQTMKIDDKQFQKELNLVKRALETEKGEQKLIKYLTPLLSKAGREFIAKQTINKQIDQNVALNAGWTYLHMAMRTYMTRVEMMKSEESSIYCFSEYFTWFIKQGIHEYLQTQK